MMKDWLIFIDFKSNELQINNDEMIFKKKKASTKKRF